jgi:hypothetical protein
MGKGSIAGLLRHFQCIPIIAYLGSTLLFGLINSLRADAAELVILFNVKQPPSVSDQNPPAKPAPQLSHRKTLSAAQEPQKKKDLHTTIKNMRKLWPRRNSSFPHIP